MLTMTGSRRVAVRFSPGAERLKQGLDERVRPLCERARVTAWRAMPGSRLFQQPTLSDMTMYEMNFSLLVEDMLGNIDQPKYRQIIVEVCVCV